MALVPAWPAIDPVADELRPNDIASDEFFNDVYQRLMFLREGGGGIVRDTGLINIEGTGLLWFPSSITVSAFRVAQHEIQRAYLYITRPDGTRIVLLSVAGSTTTSRSRTWDSGVYSANLPPGMYGLYTLHTRHPGHTLQNLPDNQIVTIQQPYLGPVPPSAGEISTRTIPMLEI